MYRCIPQILNKKNSKLIGINGSSCAGKTTLSEEIKGFLISQKQASIIVSMDWFLRKRSERSVIMNDPRTAEDIEIYVYKAWDIERFVKVLNRINCVKEFTELHLQGLYDRVTGECDNEKDLKIDNTTIIIVEGTEAVNKETESLYGCKIKINTKESVVLDRILAREKSKPIEKQVQESELIRRYNILERYYVQYLKHKNENFDIYIDNSNFEKPTVVVADISQDKNEDDYDVER